MRKKQPKNKYEEFEKEYVKLMNQTFKEMQGIIINHSNKLIDILPEKE